VTKPGGPRARRGPIRWRRARDGFVTSHDGRWQIAPLYWDCTRPQVYELSRDGQRVSSYHATQRDAKEDAERIGDSSPQIRSPRSKTKSGDRP